MIVKVKTMGFSGCVLPCVSLNECFFPWPQKMECTIDAAIPKYKVKDLMTQFVIPFLVNVDFRL